MINRVGLLILSMICLIRFSFSQTGDDDYYLGNGFDSGDTVYTNSGTFWDAGGLANYGTDELWKVWFCSNNGNPITFDFSDFATDYRGPFPNPPQGEFRNYDYLTIYYGDDSAHAYHDDTPQFTFTSPDGCIGFRFRSQPTSLTQNGWSAEISANPPPSNNDPCTAAALIVGNVCAPSVFNNKGAYGTGYGSPSCHQFFSGDVWFTAEVPASGQLKIETLAGTLDWAVMVIYTGADCNSLTELYCDETTSAMPTRILTGRTPGETIYIRIFGDQAKSGTFGICASDPAAQIAGYTGPGGVGNKDENDLWLRADKGVLNSGSTEASPGESVQTWNDQSGNDNHVSQAVPGNQPLLVGNAINGRPMLTFNGTSQYMTGELGPLSAPITMIMVNRFTAAGTDAYAMTIGNLNDNQTVSISRETDNRYYAYTQGAKYYGPPLADNTTLMIHARHNIATDFHQVFINETGYAADEYGTGVITDGSIVLGANRSIGNFLGGDIAEAIVYNHTLNAAQKIIVENCLAAKYGISIPTDRYAYQDVHGYDVAGIGQVDAANNHTHAQSARILAIGNPTDLDDGEFLLFGHDNGDLTSWISTDLPNNDINLMRVEREWRVNATGGDGIGSVTVSLFDTLMPAFPPEFISFILWVDEDGDFTTDAIPYPVVMAGNRYIANSVDLPDGCYMTIGCVRPVAGFSLPASSGFESVTNPQIEVSLNYGVSVELSLQYRAIDGSATGGGVDYLLNPDELTLLPGTKTSYIVPLIVDNDIPEPDKTFEIRISSPSLGLMLSADTVHTYTILNDDIEVTAVTDTDSIGSCFPAVANLDVNVTGTGPFTYAWTPTDSLSDPSAADPVANPSQSTWYRIEVTDQTNGAVGTDSILITVLAALSQPIITAGGDTDFCSGDSVQLSSSAGTAYLWSNGETTQDIWAKISGSYTVRIFDDAGCGSEPSDPVPVNARPLPDQPQISASGPVNFCDGDSVDLISSAAASYLWSNGDTNQTIRVKSNGNFFVEVTDSSGCQSVPSVTTTVTVYNLPPTPVITVNGTTDICEHDSVILTSSPGIAYVWSTGDTTRSIAANIAGDYSVQTVNGVGCLSLSSDTVSITTRPAPAQPNITYTGNTVFCDGDSLVLTASAGTAYLWSSGDTSREISARASGSYTVRVSNPDGCFSLSSDPVDITVHPHPEKPEITGDRQYCAGDSAMLSGPLASAYLWSTGETTPTVYVRNGSYSLTVTDANGCSSPASDTAVVTENPRPPRPAISPAGPIELLPGDSAILSSTPATSYSWSPGGQTTSSIIVRTAGQFTVTVSNEYGCPSDPSDTVTVTQSSVEKPVITVTGETTFCEGDAATLSAPQASAYSWSTGDTSQSIQVAMTGSYTVTVYNEFGAQSPPSDPVDITVLGSPVLNLVSKEDVRCNGETSGSVEVLATGGTTPYAYAWNSGQSGSSLTGIGGGSYIVTATDANGCQDTLHTAIEEPDALAINETITHPTCEESYDGAVEVMVTGGTPDYTIEWSNGSSGNRTEKLGPITVTVEVTDAAQCQANESYTLIPVNEACITVYEIITPNNDGHNDTWEITGLEFYPDAVIEVYDRWGRRVYRFPGDSWPWDGTRDGKVLPMDSYHYIIKLDNDHDPIIGNITIVK